MAQITGTSGDNVLDGGLFRDTISGLGGADILQLFTADFASGCPGHDSNGLAATGLALTVANSLVT
jgi:Ca2+-binding RTX toxin-like protein